MAKNSVKAETMIAIDSSTLTTSYQLIVKLDNPCFLLRIINASSEDVEISYDGTTNNDYVISEQTLQLPLQANSQPSAMVALMAKNTGIYAKGTAGDGDIYVTGYYVASEGS